MGKYEIEFIRFLKRGCIILLTLGAIAGSLSLYLLLRVPDLIWQGVGISLGLMGLLMLFFGLIRYSSFKQKEIDSKILKQLLVKASRRRKIELILLLFGIVLSIWSNLFSSNDFNLGLGVGLSISTAFLLIDSLILQWRAGLYEHEIKRKV